MYRVLSHMYVLTLRHIVSPRRDYELPRVWHLEPTRLGVDYSCRLLASHIASSTPYIPGLQELQTEARGKLVVCTAAGSLYIPLFPRRSTKGMQSNHQRPGVLRLLSRAISYPPIFAICEQLSGTRGFDGFGFILLNESR